MMRRQDTQLSAPFDPDEGPFDVIVVGSGYGGGVAACRLAEAGHRVLVLERGREYLTGEFPRDGAAAMAEFQVHLSSKVSPPMDATGLYDLRIGEGVAALVGCGLGGTSLINAGVVEAPDERVLDAFPGDVSLRTLAPWMDLARAMLGATAYPEGRSVPKLDALERAAKGLRASVVRPEIAVTFEAGTNAAGCWQSACTDCGDCVSGCNYGAKNTVLRTYLFAAHQAGARIATGAEVRTVTKDNDGSWTVSIETAGVNHTLRAPQVVLAAGTLGSTGILLRSHAAGLPVSDQLGQNVSGNGDIWAFGYDAKPNSSEDGAGAIYAIGAGTYDLPPGPVRIEDAPWRPGPTITGMIDLRESRDVGKGVVLQDGAMPGALAAGYAATFPAMAALGGDPFRFGDVGRRLSGAAQMAETAAKKPMALESAVRSGPLSRTLPLLGMGHDDAIGEIRLGAGGSPVMVWPKAGADPGINRVTADAKRAADAIAADFLTNPLWQDGMGRRVLTVHPLGGCAMADTVEQGVVDPQSRVYDPAGGVHNGLYVMDGSILPGSVGINPLLTIASLAERAVAGLIDRLPYLSGQALQIDAPPVSPPVQIDSAREVLMAVESILTQLRAALSAEMTELAEMILIGMLRQFSKTPGPKVPEKETAALLLEGNRGIEVIKPTVQVLLDLIAPIREAVEADDMPRLITALEDTFGDVSPPASLSETMEGFVALVDPDDPVPAGDAFAVAQVPHTKATLNAKIKAQTLRQVIDPSGNGAKLTGTLDVAALGDITFEIDGSFQFLKPAITQIEAWEIIYDAPLTPTGQYTATHRMIGRKLLKAQPNRDAWRDLTELAVEIYDDQKAGTCIARGRLTVDLEEAIQQAASLETGTGWSFNEAFKGIGKLRSTLTDAPDTLLTLVEEAEFRNQVGMMLLALPPFADMVEDAVTRLYRGRLFTRMAEVSLRAYGGLYSYMMDGPAARSGEGLIFDPALPAPEIHWPVVGPDLHVRLTRFNRNFSSNRRPVLIAGGFGTNVHSLASDISGTSLAGELTAAGHDVWLLDYRGSGAIPASLAPFTLDDVARTDWPRAIDLVCDRTGADGVDVVGHCVGAMTGLMARLAGENRIKSMVVSQLGVHPITSWSNHAKADARLARIVSNGLPDGLLKVASLLGLPKGLERIARDGLNVVDPRSGMNGASPSGLSAEEDNILDALIYALPILPKPACTSPTCRRIDFLFGPSFCHENLDAATHDAIRHMFGPVSTAPFAHLARIFRAGRVIDADGADAYMTHKDRLDIPLLFLAGASNRQMLPEATLRTLHWLGPDRQAPVERRVFAGYGHMDTFIGQTAARDIFPDILAFLARQNAP